MHIALKLCKQRLFISFPMYGSVFHQLVYARTSIYVHRLIKLNACNCGCSDVRNLFDSLKVMHEKQTVNCACS